MRTALIAFSENGLRLQKRIAQALSESGRTIDCYVKGKRLEGSMDESLADWSRERFSDSDEILFIGAAGIAVRAIAPFIVSKDQDPAVLVIDELGRFCIPLLSGHLGGANALAENLAILIGALPVVTTATDLNGLFAVDVFAASNDLIIDSLKLAKEVSAALLAGERVGFASEFPLAGSPPKELTLTDEAGRPLNGSAPPPLGIFLGVHESEPFAQTLRLIPKAVCLGMGCKRGKEAASLLAFAKENLSDDTGRIDPRSLFALASIDRKESEEGLIALSKALEIPFWTFSARELNSLCGDFTGSDFVRRQVGTESVCERSAVFASGGRLIRKKCAGEGMTLALALREVRCRYS